MKWLTIALLLTASCGADNAAPSLSPLSDQKATVGVEFSLSLRATDPERDPLTFSAYADSAGINTRARVEPAAHDLAVFRWLPLAQDLGVHAVDFTVSDGENESRSTISIEVLASGKGTSPSFVKPLGSGTTIDLRKQTCLQIPIVVADPDSTEVVLGQADPALAGSLLEQDGPLSGSWSWCPSKAQQLAGDRHPVEFIADDGDHPAVTKDYLVVLLGGLTSSCSGEPPVITHVAKDFEGSTAISIEAAVRDDHGLKYPPLVYYSSTEPAGEPPDLTSMTQLTMDLKSGDMKDGVWQVEIPNAVAELPGQSAPLYYLIVAQDEDAEDCSHYGYNPASGSHKMTVRNTGTTSCTDDPREDDDSAQQAHSINLNFGPYRSANNAICSQDDDWHEVFMYAGEALHATLTFTQSSDAQDLDLRLYRAGTNLNGCTEQTPQNCDPSKGQSSDSNERGSWFITQGDYYYLVVHGYNGSENNYDICVGLSSTDCP